MNAGILAALDAERQALGEPAGQGGVVRELAADGSECRIVFSQLSAEGADDVIAAEMSQARERGYALEWKLYGHDAPADLGRRLHAAGFAADDLEQVLMVPVNETTPMAFGATDCVVRRVHDEAGLADYAEIARAIGRENFAEEKRQLAAVLLAAPDTMSVHVAYVDGEPASCGRVYFRAGGAYAELAGGRTKPAYRNRGLFGAVVAARLAEARERGRTLVFTDALPTSEPILSKRGFQVVTSTQPFLYEP